MVTHGLSGFGGMFYSEEGPGNTVWGVVVEEILQNSLYPKGAPVELLLGSCLQSQVGLQAPRQSKCGG